MVLTIFISDISFMRLLQITITLVKKISLALHKIKMVLQFKFIRSIRTDDSVVVDQSTET